MKKRLSQLLLFLMLLQGAMCQEIYDKIRVWSDDTDATLSSVLAMGVDPEGLDVRPGIYIDMIVNQNEKQWIESQEVASEVLISDLASYYASVLAQGDLRELGYGSMGGYLTFDEIVASMDSLHANYPEIVSPKESIGQSLEGRHIWAFKVSDSPNIEDGDPEVLYNSLIHAREPAAMMTLMHFAWTLAETYTEDPTMTYLVNERDMWFIPVVNPDGYVRNELTHPDGGGMQRKNRRPGCTSSPGVDLNRNWGFHWGYDDTGSSPDECAATYRGTQAFSEPETQAVRDFVMDHNFQTVFNYHSYGNLLIKPFGYDESVALPFPDNNIYSQLGNDLVADNGYLYGTGTETVGYTVNGDAVDYMYGELGIINFTPEVGAGSDGAFWPTAELAFEMADENLSMNTHLAGCAGSWIDINSFSLLFNESINPGDTLAAALNIQNKGLADHNSTAALHLVSPDTSLMPSQAFIDISGLEAQSVQDYGADGLSFHVNAQTGELAQLVLSIEMSGYVTQVDTFTWIVGTPDTLFHDDFEMGAGLWTSSTWGIEADHEGINHFMSDSPSGYYPSSTTTMLHLTEAVDLRGYANPVLRFTATWDIENNYDFCQVLASDDGGENWIALSGKYTDAGNGSSAQPLDEPGYQGTHGWSDEQLSLSQFAGSPSVQLSFKLMSDQYIQGDGFKFDDFSVLGWGPGFLLGDLSADGFLTVSDAILLLESIVANDEMAPELVEIADTNLDGLIDVRDLVILVELILAQ